MEADQSPTDDMPDERTNEEVGEQRKANIRKIMVLENGEKEAKNHVQLKERTSALKVASSRRQLDEAGGVCGSRQLLKIGIRLGL